MTDWMECWGKARERVVKATFVGAGKEGLCPQMQNPRLCRGIFIYGLYIICAAVIKKTALLRGRFLIFHTNKKGACPRASPTTTNN